jgi:RNA polymerase sigma-70 factor (ECF subfamily)
MAQTNSIKIYLPFQEAITTSQSSIQHEEPINSAVKELNEAKLISLCLKQDRKAQKMLYEKHGPTMKLVCLRYLYDKALAEEILNKAFFKVFGKLKQYKNNGSFEGWIRKIVVNECLDCNRQYKQTIRLEEQFDHRGFSTQPEVENNHNLAFILRAVNQLPEGYRLVFNMIEIDGFTHKEVADKLGITASASRSQLTKAKKALREKLELARS